MEGVVQGKRVDWDVGGEMLDLHDIAEIAIGVCHNSLVGVCALRKLRAYPIEPTADRFPPFFDCAAKSSRKSGVVRLGPECFEGGGLAVLEFELCRVNLGQHRLKFLAGYGPWFTGIHGVNFAGSDQHRRG